MKKILVPTDFSDNSLNALEYAVELSKLFPSKIYLANAYVLPYSHSGMLVSIDKELKKEAESDLNKTIRHIRERHQGEKLEIEPVAIKGETVDSVCEYAKNHKMDIIVMGTQGASGAWDELIGTNTYDVVKSTNKPVLIVPEKAVFEIPGKIAFAADFNKISNEVVLDMLIFLAQKFDAEIEIVHIETPEENEVFNRLNDIEGVEASLSKYLKDVKHSFQVIEGEDVFKSINGYIAENNIKFLTVVSRRRELFERIFHKSVSKKVTLHTSVPLLVLHDNA